ncbi:hypothetical protein [Nonomuraea sp. NPDC049504]|uniref:hypothetical protein n=1 Tax=Nonomuraea sp. NPDC049504 TaxID=3154729 RepID=UPI00341ECCBD
MERPTKGIARFAAAHPVRLGVIAGSSTGALMVFFSLIGDALGAEHALALDALLLCLGIAVFLSVTFVGLGYFGRLHSSRPDGNERTGQDEPG